MSIRKPEMILIDVDGTLVDSDLYAENTSKRSRLYPGVREGLDHLKSRGYKLGCVTNKAAQFTLPLLKDLGVYEDFGIVISGDTLPVKKPDPGPLLHAARHFGVEPEDALMIGDSISDVKVRGPAPLADIVLAYNEPLELWYFPSYRRIPRHPYPPRPGRRPVSEA